MKKEAIYRIFARMPDISTDRLLLRRITVDDIDDMYEYAKNATLTRYLTWSPHPDKAYTFEYVTYLQSRYKTGEFFDWAVTLKDGGKMIGTCGFTRFDFQNDAGEIGYVINPEYQGRGIATEALGAVIKFGFEDLALNRIECRFMTENEVSRRVMQKNGMTFEGVLRRAMLVKGEYRDVGVCSILRSEYEDNKR